MKRFFLLSLILSLFSFKANCQQPNATEVVKKANDLMNGRSSESTATMTIVRPSWSRKVSMKTWSLGNDYYMILITSPPQDKGQVFLKRNNEMWNWMPTLAGLFAYRLP